MSWPTRDQNWNLSSSIQFFLCRNCVFFVENWVGQLNIFCRIFFNLSWSTQHFWHEVCNLFYVNDVFSNKLCVTFEIINYLLNSSHKDKSIFLNLSLKLDLLRFHNRMFWIVTTLPGSRGRICSHMFSRKPSVSSSKDWKVLSWKRHRFYKMSQFIARHTWHNIVCMHINTYKLISSRSSIFCRMILILIIFRKTFCTRFVYVIVVRLSTVNWKISVSHINNLSVNGENKSVNINKFIKNYHLLNNM